MPACFLDAPPNPEGLWVASGVLHQPVLLFACPRLSPRLGPHTTASWKPSGLQAGWAPSLAWTTPGRDPQAG